MKILLVLFLSMCFVSCKNPENPYVSGIINNSDSNEGINENQNPEEFIKTTLSTIELPNCPENSNFDMIAINFTDGRTEDDLILGENQYCKKSSSNVEIPYPVKVKQFKMSKYMVSYNTWYHVYQWAIKNGYKFIGKGSEGMYAKGNDAGVYYPFNEGGKPQVEEMPVGSVNWRDAIVWCNALSEMLKLTPVYYSDANFKTPLRDSTQSTTVFADTTWDMTPGKIDNPYVNTKANGYRLPYTAEWEYAARKKKMELVLREEMFPVMKVVLFMNIHPQIQLMELNFPNQRFLEIICGTDIMQLGNVQKQPAEKMIQML